MKFSFLSIFKIGFSLIFFSLMVLCAQGWGQKPEFKTYHNFQYSFSLSYPSELFTQQKGTQTKAENIFISPDGLAKINAQGAYLSHPKNLNQIINDKLKIIEKYKLLKKESTTKSFILTYEKENQTQVLEKYVLHQDILKTLHIEYPISHKELFEPITKQIAQSFPNAH